MTRSNSAPLSWSGCCGVLGAFFALGASPDWPDLYFGVIAPVKLGNDTGKVNFKPRGQTAPLFARIG